MYDPFCFCVSDWMWALYKKITEDCRGGIIILIIEVQIPFVLAVDAGGVSSPIIDFRSVSVFHQGMV